MALTQTGKQKAATLLMNLDSATAGELLQGLTSDEIEELAVEMAQISTSGRRNKKDESRIVREFSSGLQKGDGSQKFSLSGFLSDTLVNVLGEEKAKKVQSQVSWTGTQDVFGAIRFADADQLAPRPPRCNARWRRAAPGHELLITGGKVAGRYDDLATLAEGAQRLSLDA